MQKKQLQIAIIASTVLVVLAGLGMWNLLSGDQAVPDETITAQPESPEPEQKPEDAVETEAPAPIETPEETAVVAAPPPSSKPKISELRKLLRSFVDVNDPIALARSLTPDRLVGQAHKDFWRAFKRDRLGAVSSHVLRLKGQTLLLVNDMPDGNGCGDFYDAEGRYVLSACGTLETDWRWRVRR